jgi:hypothetical protein
MVHPQIIRSKSHHVFGPKFSSCYDYSILRGGGGWDSQDYIFIIGSGGCNFTIEAAALLASHDVISDLGKSLIHLIPLEMIFGKAESDCFGCVCTLCLILGVATLLDDWVSKQCATYGALLIALKIPCAIETKS